MTAWLPPVPAAARVQRRRALEALRAGVPNRDAVMVLGSLQVGVEDRFSQLLDTAEAVPTGRATGGILLGGGFGSGKSHVLEHLAHVALGRGFVVSKVVISKETPLHDPAKVFRAAIDEALVPGRPGSAIDEIAAALNPESVSYADLYRFARSYTPALAPLIVSLPGRLLGRLAALYYGPVVPAGIDFLAALREVCAGGPHCVAASPL